MKKSKWRAKRMVGLLPMVVGLLIFLASPPAPVKADAWEKGDIFVGNSTGAYQVYDNAGNLKETINSGLGYAGTGAAFNPDQTKLYTTNFFSSKVSVFDVNHPHTVLQTIQTGSADAESVVFDKAGNFYVGHADGNRDVEKYDAAGNLLDTFDVPTQNRGSDWIDLASDQNTLFYTSEGTRILRYDLSTKTALSDFGSTAGPYNFALRILPPGDGSGGVIVANYSHISRLDGAGDVVQTYDVTGEDSWFALNLDPNGTSFWSAGFNGRFYRFNIDTGAVEVGPILTGVPEIDGICLMGEPTAGVIVESIDLTPQSVTNQVNTDHTVTARVHDDKNNLLDGREVTFNIISGPHAGLTGTDATDSNGEATFTYTGTLVGTDTIEASFVDSNGQTKTSNQVTKTWEEATAIELKSFKARTGSNGKVNLTWETVTEVDNAGFNLYRAESANGSYIKINDTLIAAKGTAVSGARYKFVDKPGDGTFYYKLEDIDYNGQSALHGPVDNGKQVKQSRQKGKAGIVTPASPN